MSQNNDSTIRKKGQHLDYSSRKIIERLLKKKVPLKEIAETVDIAESTLSDERRRGEVLVKRVVREKELKWNNWQGREIVVEEWLYCAETAQADANKKKEKSKKHFQIFKNPKYVEFIEALIISNKKKLSPDTANAKAKEAGFKTVSTKTLYNWIEWGLLKIKPMDLLLKTRRKQPSKIKKQKRILGKSIDERPKEVENREEIGHWEGDSIVGAEHKGQIITLVERKHRIGWMFKFNKMRAENMLVVLRKLKKLYGTDFKSIFKSITFDNGSEFSYNKKMSKFTDIYYAHTYCSWERGTNENFNGIVRRFIPKGSDITKLSQSDIERINNCINTMPRRILKYKTALESFQLEIAAA